MKEQGQEFNPSKEPVKKETIEGIVGECRRIFNIDLPFLKEDFPVERQVRIAYSASGEQISVFRGGRFIIEIDGSRIPSVRSRHYDIDFIARNTGNNTFSIRLTEDLKSKKLIDWDRNYRGEHDFIEEGEKLTYMYVVDSDEKNSFMQLYFTGNVFIAYAYRGPRQFSSLQSKRVESILDQAFPAEPGENYIFTHEARLDPLANPVVPSEPLANNLLEFMQRIVKVSRFTPKAIF